MCRSEPSIFMVKIWSHFKSSRVDWKMSFLPSAEKYASAFWPPNVSWRTLPRCFSSGVRRSAVEGFFSWEDPQVTRNRITRADRNCNDDCFPHLARCLFSLFEFDGRCNWLTISQHLNLDNIPHFATPERIGKVIQIFDGLIAELHQNVSRLESCLGRRGLCSHIRESHSVFYLAKIRDGTEIRTVPASATASGSGFVFNDRGKSRPLSCVRKFHPH